MIAEFLDSWELFRATYLAGWLIAALLGVVGVWVVARNQVFLGIAVAQASTLGIALALWIGGLGVAAGVTWLQSDTLTAALAVTASVSTALLTARVPAPGRESAEAMTGWVYLVAASLPVLMLAASPHGLEEIHRLMFSTILGASNRDLTAFSVLLAITVGLVVTRRDALLLFAQDPEMATAVGVPRRLMNASVAIWLGLAVGLSIRVSGTLYTFGCLVLPALIAKNLSREIRPLLWRAPAIGVVTAVVAFVAAHRADVPPAHATVALLCAELVVAWAVRRLGADR